MLLASQLKLIIDNVQMHLNITVFIEKLVALKYFLWHLLGCNLYFQCSDAIRTKEGMKHLGKFVFQRINYSDIISTI